MDIFIENTNASTNMIKLLDLPNDTPRQLRLGNNIKFVGTEWFVVKLFDLYSFNNDLLTTSDKYIFPTTFLLFSKKYVSYDSNIQDPRTHKLMYSRIHLQQLQMWANQFRQQFNKVCSDNHDRLSNKQLYFVYMLALYSVQFILNDNDNIRYKI